MARAEADQGPAAPASTSTESVYYRHQDAAGKVTIVDSLEKLPAGVRVEAERVVLTGAPAVRVDAGVHGESTTAALLTRLDATSFALGLGAGVLAVGLIGLMLGRLSAGAGRRVLRGALAVGVVLLIVGSYLGWVRRAAGLGNGALASPGQLLEDARDAADRVRQQRAAQQRELEEVRRTAQ